MAREPEGRCAAVREELGELALGILPGQERAALLAHVERCAACTAALAELAQVAGVLIGLAGENEPPSGFEGRVLAHAGTHRNERRRRAVLVSVAAGVVGIGIGLGVGVGLGVGSGSGAPSAPNAAIGQTARPQVTSAPLRAGTRTVGEVDLVTGKPSWLLMSLRAGTLAGTVTCRIALANGTEQTVGRFDASAYDSAWTSEISTTGVRVVRAFLVDTRGRTVAVANLH